MKASSILKRYSPLAILRSVAVFSIIFLGLAPVFGPSAYAGPHQGGTLRIAQEFVIYGFDAIKSPALPATGVTAANLVMEQLFDRGENGALIPVLGLSATPNADETIWTIELRRGVLFHDGTPFNADAVVAHWQRLLDPKNRYRGRFVLQAIDKVEKAGPYTVVFHMKHPWKPFLDVLTSHGGFTARIPSPKAVADESQNRRPVGTGPFVFKNWISGDRIELARNPDYWKKGLPYLDEIIIRPIPDHQARYAALASGQVDLIFTDRPIHIDKLASDPNFRMITAGGSGTTYLLFNLKAPPLSDVRLRKALAYAFDQKAYIKLCFGDKMRYVEDWYGDTLSCGDVGYRKPDLEKAESYMKGIEGPIVLDYLHTATPRGRETAQILQQMFGRIGVTVNPVPLSLVGIIQRVIKGDFHMSSWGISGAEDMGPLSKVVFHSKGPHNFSGFSDPVVDELLDRQDNSLDENVRKEALCEVARRVNDEVPLLFMFGRKYHVFTNLKVNGVPPPRNEFIRLSEAWLEP